MLDYHTSQLYSQITSNKIAVLHLLRFLDNGIYSFSSDTYLGDINLLLKVFQNSSNLELSERIAIYITLLA